MSCWLVGVCQRLNCRRRWDPGVGVGWSSGISRRDERTHRTCETELCVQQRTVPRREGIRMDGDVTLIRSAARWTSLCSGQHLETRPRSRWPFWSPDRVSSPEGCWRRRGVVSPGGLPPCQAQAGAWLSPIWTRDCGRLRHLE